MLQNVTVLAFAILGLLLPSASYASPLPGPSATAAAANINGDDTDSNTNNTSNSNVISTTSSTTTSPSRVDFIPPDPFDWFNGGYRVEITIKDLAVVVPYHTALDVLYEATQDLQNQMRMMRKQLWDPVGHYSYEKPWPFEVGIVVFSGRGQPSVTYNGITAALFAVLTWVRHWGPQMNIPKAQMYITSPDGGLAIGLFGYHLLGSNGTAVNGTATNSDDGEGQDAGVVSVPTPNATATAVGSGFRQTALPAATTGFPTS